MSPEKTTVIICCAGMGTRLGIGTTKALVNICGKSLIIRLLEQLDGFDDIRIVVGYQAEKLIKIVNNYRKDILYAFNREYEHTGPATSMWKALKKARDNIVIIDGDVVINPLHFKDFLKMNDECIAYSYNLSDEPTYLNISNGKIINFSTGKTKYIFSGIICINKKHIFKGDDYIYNTIEHNLPLIAKYVDVCEIDTQDDYEKAVSWVKNSYKKFE